jgi:hypothetical protein
MTPGNTMLWCFHAGGKDLIGTMSERTACSGIYNQLTGGRGEGKTRFIKSKLQLLSLRLRM